MKRSFHQFHCHDDLLAGTLDDASVGDAPYNSTGLLIVSGGNEIRSGAHAGIARLAHKIAENGFPVFRYDRRGIGDSSGTNQGFLGAKDDINAAAEYFRKARPSMEKIVAFGNCDAASALVLFGKEIAIDEAILANPWVIEQTGLTGQSAATLPPSAIRSRYWQRLKKPKSIADLLTGKIDLKKLLSGLKQASRKQENTPLSLQLRDGLAALNKPCTILLADRDTTALAFLAAWNSADFAQARALPDIALKTIDSASHSFADDRSGKWLEDQLLKALKNS
ncbi:hydrolase 1, exosortase A system-associated [Parasphingorhabdus sp.]|uniref:hydrolase 1, exosortase A system-associated n=1 Tax=Parasphingorhabdus sp. TaxID=2709688 RepID=UPI002F945EA9